MSEGGSGEETTAEKVITLQRAMTKKVVSFFRKTKLVTPSVAAPGDTNLSDATAKKYKKFRGRGTKSWLRRCLCEKSHTVTGGEVESIAEVRQPVAVLGQEDALRSWRGCNAVELDGIGQHADGQSDNVDAVIARVHGIRHCQRAFHVVDAVRYDHHHVVGVASVAVGSREHLRHLRRQQPHASR